jgi:hypothetical protein
VSVSQFVGWMGVRKLTCGEDEGEERKGEQDVAHFQGLLSVSLCFTRSISWSLTGLRDARECLLSSPPRKRRSVITKR